MLNRLMFKNAASYKKIAEPQLFFENQYTKCVLYYVKEEGLSMKGWKMEAGSLKKLIMLSNLFKKQPSYVSFGKTPTTTSSFQLLSPGFPLSSSYSLLLTSYF